jgi:hypothetical protein
MSALTGSSTAVTTTIGISSSTDSTGTHLTYSAFVTGNSTWLTIVGANSGTTPGNATTQDTPT